eukprot:TRINITY_DN22588_c0_g1_i1.p1 TRINITY_DN22588_c0_g1~~TRINITY_DN22588_c0_g1_i1.p1  ORF type:complete len:491 (+),score=165.68 TRINITY_DN22588_c0_g1_i1:87-1475(+)
MAQGGYTCKQCRASILPDTQHAGGLRRDLPTVASTGSFYYCASPVGRSGPTLTSLESYESLDAEASLSLGRRPGMTHAASVESFVDVGTLGTPPMRPLPASAAQTPVGRHGSESSMSAGPMASAMHPSYNTVLVARALKHIRDGRGDVEGAVCEGCHSLLLAELRREADDMTRDRALVERQLALLHGDDMAPDVSDEALDKLTVQKEAHRAHLTDLDAEVASLGVEAARLEAELAAVEDEADHHTRAATTAAVYKPFQAAEEAASDAACREYIAARKARCEGLAGLGAFFHIDASGVPASINGCRMGIPDTLSSSEQGEISQYTRVPWEELNTGLGHLALLVDTLRRKSRYYSKKKPRITFVLQGSTSRVVVPHSEHPTSNYPLFCEPGSSTTSLDEGIAYLSKALVKVAINEDVALEHDVVSQGAWKRGLTDGQNPEWPMYMQQVLRNANHLMHVLESRRG